MIHYWANVPDPDAVTLVFLPGLTADHRLFDKQIQHFENKYNVVVWDAPAHASSWPFRLDFDLFDENEITIHKAAKNYFDGLGLKELPTIKALNTEYLIGVCQPNTTDLALPQQAHRPHSG